MRSDRPSRSRGAGTFATRARSKAAPRTAGSSLSKKPATKAAGRTRPAGPAKERSAGAPPTTRDRPAAPASPARRTVPAAACRCRSRGSGATAPPAPEPPPAATARRPPRRACRYPPDPRPRTDRSGLHRRVPPVRETRAGRDLPAAGPTSARPRSSNRSGWRSAPGRSRGIGPGIGAAYPGPGAATVVKLYPFMR